MKGAFKGRNEYEGEEKSIDEQIIEKLLVTGLMIFDVKKHLTARILKYDGYLCC